MSRSEGRLNSQLRKIKVVKNVLDHPQGSCEISFGRTRVICTASVEDSVPPFLKGSGTGWVTAEYGMLPGSTSTRIKRDKAMTSGRTQEIQRLIGRSLRVVVDMTKLGERTIKIDCDVIQADGGTRTAAVTGGFIALGLALKKLYQEKVIPEIPIKDYVAAVSVGIVKGTAALDLDYSEDSSADMDMNVVMVGQGSFVEVQGTGEKKPFSSNQMSKLLKLAQKGIKELLAVQRKTLGLKV
jgi:ribonuclease PH